MLEFPACIYPTTTKMPINIFWFRRDLRLLDNHGLYRALKSSSEVLPLFIFDDNILDKLSPDDLRIPFIHQQVRLLDDELRKYRSCLLIKRGDPVVVFEELLQLFDIANVFTNEDFEPYAIERDNSVQKLLKEHGKDLQKYNDQLIFRPGEILKPNGKPYEIFTPFSKNWLERFENQELQSYPVEQYLNSLYKTDSSYFPTIEELGFNSARREYPSNQLSISKISDYALSRDYPWMDATSRIGPHLRFGTISIRRCVEAAAEYSSTWLNELIWREFFMHILALFPYVANGSFRRQYDKIVWLNDESQFEKWCKGLTGYPLVDAGMREMNTTGFMHNRVRMTVASFLVKHLLIDWRWGEAWFASHLLDFDLASNNGNWQWVAGCGCDAAPYFRIFNPVRQQVRFDPEFKYIKKWVPEYGTPEYPLPMIDHNFARNRCIAAYKKAVE